MPPFIRVGILAVIVAIVVGLILGLVGIILMPTSVSAGDWFEHWGWTLGILSGLYYFVRNAAF